MVAADGEDWERLKAPTEKGHRILFELDQRASDVDRIQVFGDSRPNRQIFYYTGVFSLSFCNPCAQRVEL